MPGARCAGRAARGGGRGPSAAAVVAAALVFAACFTVECQARRPHMRVVRATAGSTTPPEWSPNGGVKLTFSTTQSGTTAPSIGINLGHRHPASNHHAVLKWLGAGAARLFGCSGLGSGGLVGLVGSAAWGRSLSGADVANQTAFNAAVAELRSPAGRDPASTSAWAYPVKWAAVEANLGTTDTSSPAAELTGNPNATLAALHALGVRPLPVFQITCSALDYTTVSTADPAFWRASWESYKHQYALSRWAYARGVIDIEFYNEPDLEACLQATPAKWLEHYTLRTGAIRDAYADYSGGATAPQILASAFSRRTYGGDPTQYFGQPTVQARFTRFPASANSTDPSRCNMDAYSYHAYGKSGSTLSSDVSGLATSIKGDAPAGFDVVVTEHAAHTGASWDTLATTPEAPAEASTLAGEVVALATAAGSRGYVFKLTATPSSGGGVAKNGIGWGDSSGLPYHISAPSLSAAGLALLIRALQGAKPILTVTGTSGLPKTAYLVATKDGEDNLVTIVNDAATPFNASLDITAWAPASDIIVSQASATSRGEVTQIVSLTGAPATKALAQTLPANSVTVIRVPTTARARIDVRPAAYDTQVRAGSASATAFLSLDTLGVGTSVTTDQSLTVASLLSFSLPVAGSAVKAAVLSLTVNNVTAAKENNLQVICIDPARWSGAPVTWSDLAARGILTAPPQSAPITSTAQNFIAWPPASSGDLSLRLAGGVWVPGAGAGGSVKRVDVTDCARAFGATSVGVLLYRPFRNDAAANTAPVAADDLSGGAWVNFYSSEAASAAVRPMLSVWA